MRHNAVLGHTHEWNVKSKSKHSKSYRQNEWVVKAKQTEKAYFTLTGQNWIETSFIRRLSFPKSKLETCTTASARPLQLQSSRALAFDYDLEAHPNVSNKSVIKKPSQKSTIQPSCSLAYERQSKLSFYLLKSEQQACMSTAEKCIHSETQGIHNTLCTSTWNEVNVAGNAKYITWISENGK
jgi:hypothetical protein